MILDPATVRRLTAQFRPPEPSPNPRSKSGVSCGECPSQPQPSPKPANLREQVIDAARAGETVKDTAARLNIPQRTVLYYRSNSGPVKFPVALTCPHCGKNGWHEVIDSRGVPDGGYIRRRRECSCGKRFTTEERVKL